MKSLSRGHLKAGIDSVRGAKFRSFWTMLGVIIGVASVITVVAIGQGVKQQISGQIHSMGENVITVRPAQPNSGGPADGASLISGFSVSGPLGAKDVDLIDRVPGVAASAPLTLVGGEITSETGTYKEGLIIGTSGDLPGLLNQSMAYGTFFDDEDHGLKVAVVGQDASEAMFNSDVPLGRSFDFRGQRFIVRGVFNQFTMAPLSQQADFNNAIFIPNDVAEELTKNSAPTYEVLARADSSANTGAVAGKIRAGLDKAHGGHSGFSVMTGNQNLANSSAILDLLTRLIAGVAAISLLVGGIGIMNVMLVSVAERTHEIGIRKAVGATNSQIMSQFMIEASLLSLVGGLIGIGLAFMIELLLQAFTTIQPVISWQTVALATGVSLLVGVVFGTIPALKAARKDPIQALRSE